MKRAAVVFIVIILVGVLGIIVNKAINLSKNLTQIESGKTSSPDSMPAFEFTTLNGELFTKENLNPQKSTIIVRFDSDCSLCEKSGKVFSKFKKFHKNSNVLFVSSNTVSKIRSYGKRFTLDTIPNVIFLQSEDEEFLKQFNEIGTPTYFIYNSSGGLIKTINDDIPVKVLLRYIKASQIDDEV